MKLVDQAGMQVLPNGGHAAANADVAPAGGGPRLIQRRVDAAGDKPELGAAGHAERWSWVMRQHEDGRVIRRFLAPPTLPVLVRPRAADGAEHVSTENPGAKAGEALLCDVVVDAGLAVRMSVHPAPCTRGKKPLHQLR